MLCKRSYPKNRSIENLASGRQRLPPGSLFHKRFRLEAVHFCKPRPSIRNDWLQQDSIANTTNAHFVSLKTEVTRKSHGLASAIAKEFCGFAFDHVLSPTAMIYTMNIDPLSRCPNAVDSAKVLVDTRRKAERWAKCSITIIAKPHDGGRGRRKPCWVLCIQPLFQLEDDLQSAPAVIR